MKQPSPVSISISLAFFVLSHVPSPAIFTTFTFLFLSVLLTSVVLSPESSNFSALLFIPSFCVVKSLLPTPV